MGFKTLMNFWQKLWGVQQHEIQSNDDEGFDPDALLEQAQRQMREVHARNRERAVQAITQKNNLEQMVKDLEKKTELLKAKAEIADNRGEADIAVNLRKEMASYENSLLLARQSLQQAVEVSEQVKSAIRQEEERIRQKTAEALALQTQWRTTQVQRSLLASLVEINAGVSHEVPPSERALRHARNRRLVQQAIVQRNHLRTMRDDTEKRVQSLRENALVARQRENDTLENQLLREMEQYEATLAGTREAVGRAEEVTERAIGLLKEEEESLRALGLDPLAVTDADVALYEARVALASVENEDISRRRREGRLLWVAVAAITLLAVLLVLLL